MNRYTEFAQQQLLGYFHAKRGYSLLDLISDMELSKQEWVEINKESVLDMNEEERQEIEQKINEISRISNTINTNL